MSLLGKSVVITGARGGIGFACVEEFAKEGANIWACARTENPDFELQLAKLGQDNDVDIRPLYFDLSDKEAIKAATKTIFATKQYPSVLVNNAGVMHTGLFQMTPVDQIRSVFESNFFGAMELTQLLLRGMIRNTDGAIVNIASIAGQEAIRGNSAYGASKAAVISWTKTLAVELASNNIRVNAIAPGLTKTSISDGFSEDDRQMQISSSAMGRLGDPHEIARIAVFLASDEASFVNGDVIRADGGWISY